MLKHRRSVGKIIFDLFNYAVLTAAALSCLLPFVNLLAISFSKGSNVAAGEVTFIPIGFNLSAYKFILQSQKFIDSFLISLQRVSIGVVINVIMVILVAYPLSKERKSFKARSFYAWFFIITMLFSPSLIPSYMVIRQLHLLDSIWSLLLPGALPVFSMIVMLNFFRNLPKALEEAAFMDGAGHLTILLRIFIPVSKPSIATIALFSVVGHWNSWFDGLIYMNNPANYPLQSYLQTIVINPEALMRIMKPTKELIDLLMAVNNKTAKAAQLFIATVPVLVIYPLLQKYFTAGLVLGSTKE